MSECGSDRCITCADEGIPMRVLARAPDNTARCADDEGRETDVMVDLVGDVAPGDRVLVHAGVALARLEAAVAA